jgi:hypothetical protein
MGERTASTITVSRIDIIFPELIGHEAGIMAGERYDCQGLYRDYVDFDPFGKGSRHFGSLSSFIKAVEIGQ